MTSENSLLYEMDGWVCALAPAKVNLFLHITGRRDDGYHMLESIFAFTKFGDTVKVRASDALSLKISGEFKGSLNQENPDSNLVMKAAFALRAFVGKDQGAEVILEKNLPVASGVGGGSSDAAATLRALVKLWKVEISKAELMQLGLGLGADVPACLNPQMSFISGIGERVRPIEMTQNFSCILVNTGQPLSTAEVFSAHKGMGIAFTPSIEGGLKSFDIDHLLAYKNDLFKPACSKVPDITKVVEELGKKAEVVLARMSGSGGTCFALTKTLEGAEQIAKELKKHHHHWWIEVSELIT